MRKTILFAVMIVFVVANVEAQRTKAMKNILNLNVEFGGSFLQVQKDDISQKQVKKKGVIYFSAPNRLSIEFLEPKGDRFVLNQGKMYVQEGKRGYIYNFAKHESKRRIAYVVTQAFMGRIDEVEKMIGIKAKFTESKALYIFTFEFPVNKESQYKKIEFVYSKLDYHLSMLTLEERNGNNVIYSVPAIRLGKTKDVKYEIPIPTKR